MTTMATLAGAAVAMVILVDLATGQGPPVYTNYLRAQQEMRPIGGMQPMPIGGGYMQPPINVGNSYDMPPQQQPEQLDKKEYLKAGKLEQHKSLDKFGKEEKKEPYAGAGLDDYEKKAEEGEYKHNKQEFAETTPKPAGLYDRIFKSIG